MPRNAYLHQPVLLSVRLIGICSKRVLASPASRSAQGIAILQHFIGLITAPILGALALGQSPVQAAPVSYYLSANGNDANPATITQPWRSLRIDG